MYIVDNIMHFPYGNIFPNTNISRAGNLCVVVLLGHALNKYSQIQPGNFPTIGDSFISINPLSSSCPSNNSSPKHPFFRFFFNVIRQVGALIVYQKHKQFLKYV